MSSFILDINRDPYGWKSKNNRFSAMKSVLWTWRYAGLSVAFLAEVDTPTDIDPATGCQQQQ